MRRNIGFSRRSALLLVVALLGTACGGSSGGQDAQVQTVQSEYARMLASFVIAYPPGSRVGGPHQGPIEREVEIIPYPDIEPMSRVFECRLTLHPPDRDPPAADPNLHLDPLFLDQFELFPSFRDGGLQGDPILPQRFDDRIEATAELPPNANGVSFQVLPFLDVPYYITAFIAVELDIERFYGSLSEDPVVEPARSDLVAAQTPYRSSLEAAGESERRAREAKDAFDTDPTRASELLQQSRAKLEEAVAMLLEAAEALRRVKAILDAIPAAGAQAVAVEALRKQYLIFPTRLRMQHWLQVNVDYDMPGVNFAVCGESSHYTPGSDIVSLTAAHTEVQSVIYHECAHHVFHKKTGLSLHGGHNGICGPTSEEAAWCEGFATFLGQAACGSATFSDPSYPFSMHLDDNTITTPTGTTVCRTAGPDIESNVQGVLWDVYDGGPNLVADADADGLSVPMTTIWKAVCEKPRSLAQFLTELRKHLDGEQKTALDAVLVRNNLGP